MPSIASNYARVAKQVALLAERYAHAKKSKRVNREFEFLRTKLGQLTGDIRRKRRLKPMFRNFFSRSRSEY